MFRSRQPPKNSTLRQSLGLKGNMDTKNMQGRGFNGMSLTIASVFPLERKAQRDYHPEMDGGRTGFVLEAAPKGEFRTLKLTDCWERIVSDESQVSNPVFVPRLVKVDTIAACLLKEWAINIAGTRTGRRPGIMVIAGDTPTEAEMKTLTEMQAAYFDGLINEASAFAAKHDWKSIDELHRVAAKWRGHEAEWVNDLGQKAERKECFYCAEKIMARAKVCKECGHTQPEFAAVVPDAPAPQKAVRAPIPPPMKPPAQVSA